MSSPIPVPMYLRRLALTNFRGFERFECSLDRRCNVFVGVNGSGKTSIAAATGMVLEAFPKAAGFKPKGLTDDDVRQTVENKEGLFTRSLHAPASVAVEAVLPDGQILEWTRASREPGARDAGDVFRITQWWRVFYSGGVAGNWPVPLVAAYFTRRLDRDSAPDDAAAEAAVNEPREAYRNALGRDRDFARVLGWIKTQTFADVQRGERLPHLQAVLAAIAACLPGVESVFYDIRSETLLVRTSDHKLQPYQTLSDGYVAILGIAADLAWRAVILNPHFGADAPRKTPGVVVIDELELHLHPGWQRTCLGDLLRVFSNLQFIVTTHSPQVVASADAAWVRVLEAGRAAPVPYARGLDSNTVLRAIFGVEERPHEMQAELDRLAALVDQGATRDATAQIEKLAPQLGDDDPELVRARWLLHMNGADRAS